ncbi:hypothetical protein [Winogradskya humida]|uniref:Uncharacterized protein n=1 Tax=Winogradskya humida TaxID=113566 RepID=A0ABQ3ZZ30_9ACTN|nr:hypothetical protein [Actinoplanes humidus]GIE23724.1 hypothetical protein Ahu01nite_068260 [Actinoplanes humidus]
MTTTNMPVRLQRWNRPLLVLAAAMAVLTIATLAGLAADDRIVTGAPVWLKPFKFSVSFVLYAGTLAWMLTLLPRRSRLAEWSTVVIVAMSVAEMVVIAGQAARGQTSHYNQTSALNSVLWNVMAVAIMALFVAQIVIAVVVLRARIADRVAALGVRLGLGLSSLGMLAAVPMVLPTAAPGIDNIAGAHSVGTLDGGPGLPVLGWSTVGGDLRAGHFVGLHALQALPLLALLLARLGGRLAQRTQIGLLRIAGTAYGAVTVVLTWQALRGQPVVHPDALTLTALAVIVAATATAAGVYLSANRKAVTA